jgi:hypothetical protein
MCCDSVEEEELDGRPENKTGKKFWLLNSLRFTAR